MDDFNLLSISWNDVVSDQNITACDAMFLEIFYTLGHHQWVLEPTFIRSDNILDLIFTTEPDCIQQITTFPPFPHSGHALVKENMFMFMEGKIFHLQIGPEENLVE